ncbi:hypothetical protein [Chryseobacterium sp. RLHN22]|uniref:hypothetical protein n=1 Tax=Chryseobacterium sp. RLHN22 TaxID=3437885 RepID=UPI003D9B86F9
MAKKIVKPNSLHLKVVTTANSSLKFDESQGLLTLDTAGSFSVTVKELADYVQEVENNSNERITRDKGLYAQRAKEGWTKEKLDQNWEYNNKERSATQDAALEESEKIYADINWAWVIAPKEIVASEISHNKYFSKGIGNFDKKTRTLRTQEHINFPKFLEGGGLCYLEAFFPDKPVGRPPNGIYVNAIGVPTFIRTFWTDMKGNEITADTEVAFGSRVQLHIYTAGLYGQEIEIGLMHKDKVSFDDCLQYGGQKSFFREVGIHLLKGNEVGESGVAGLLGSVADQEKAKNYIQKSVVDIWVDFSWMQQGGSSLEIYPLVKSKKTEKELKAQESVKLKVSLSGKRIDFVEDFVNNPVMIDNVETDIASFLPCGYESIYYQYGNNQEIEVFNEKKPAKITSGSFEGATISVLAPPKGSKNVKDLYVRLEKVNTNDCLLEDAYIGGNKKNTPVETHQGHVINISNLKNAGIDSEIFVPDEQLRTSPVYNYKYDKNSAWDFLKNYFLFSSLLSNRDQFENQFKGILMDWEMQSKHLINYYNIGLKTCSHQKDLHLKVYPDVAWAFHALFDDPYIPEYYNNGNTKNIKTVKGLEKEIDWLKNNPMADMFSFPIISPVLGSSLVRNFILDIIKDIADRYEFGFTAYYDFDEEGKKNSQQIDYAETHPNVFKGMIAGVVTLEILIDVLLIILTEGAALANFVSKASKVAGIVNKSSKVVRTGKKAEDILSKYSDTFANARHARMAKSKFEMMKGSYYRGYRFVDDEKIGIQPVMEERVKISPFLNLATQQKKSLGELLLDKTPLGMTLNMAKSVTGGFGLGVSSLLIGKIKGGKKAISWYGAITYPLRIANYVLEGTYNMLAFATDEALEKIFGAKAEFEKDLGAHIDLDFWLKIQNAEKKLDLLSLTKGISKTDKSSISIAPSGAFTLRLKLSGSVSNKVVVRAMHILTWNNQETGMQEMTAEGKFEAKGNIFIEKRFYFKADSKPYHEDKIIFTGLAGEYEYNVKRKTKRDDPEEEIAKREPTQFMLMEPCELVFHSTEMTKNPSDDI